MFVAGEPVPLDRLAEVLQQDCDRVARLLDEMRRRDAGGLQVAEVAGGWMLCTRPEFASYITRLLQVQPHRLSRAALETLAIIAYRQPTTRPEVDAIRGVSSDGVIRTLVSKGLIEEVGRKEAPGRPILYGTTPAFLQHFGLVSLGELPDLEDVEEGTG